MDFYCVPRQENRSQKISYNKFRIRKHGKAVYLGSILVGEASPVARQGNGADTLLSCENRFIDLIENCSLEDVSPGGKTDDLQDFVSAFGVSSWYGKIMLCCKLLERPR